MIRIIMVVAACVFGSMASAATLKSIDLVLRLDSVGYGGVTIYGSGSSPTRQISFMDASNGPVGVSSPQPAFNIGQLVTQTATFNKKTGQVSSCYTGSISCNNAFGSLKGKTFSFGDGAGQTPWGDFSLSGGTKVGDKVTLATFSGGLSYGSLVGGEFVSWDSFVQNFTVVKNNGKNNGPKVAGVSVVPVPASILFLVAGLGGFGLIARRRKKAA